MIDIPQLIVAASLMQRATEENGGATLSFHLGRFTTPGAGYAVAMPPAPVGFVVEFTDPARLDYFNALSTAVATGSKASSEALPFSAVGTWRLPNGNIEFSAVRLYGTKLGAVTAAHRWNQLAIYDLKERKEIYVKARLP